MGPGQTFDHILFQYLGLASQTATVLLLLVLFVLLRRYAGRRPYFYAWSSAWLALSAALVALLVRYLLLPHYAGSDMPEDAVAVRLCYFVYQFGKLAFLLMLLRGAMLYVSGLADPPLGYLRPLWVGAGAVSLISVVLSADQVGVLFWQAFGNVPLYLWCSLIILTLPPARRSLGTRFTGVLLALNAILWSLYLLAFLHHFYPQLGVGEDAWEFFGGRNTFFDLTLEMLLAFGMVLVLFEDGRRELDSAHQELRLAHEELLRESLVDALTGAYNRRAYTEGTGLEDARGSFGALAVFDLDELKDVNDRYGHKYGDELLKHFAKSLRSALRHSDKLYRLGGDEFLLVAPRAVAAVLEQRMRDILAEAPPLQLPDGSASMRLSASLGVADFKSGGEIESAVHAADRAMYAAKRSRKGGSVG